jgi:hypothetical protein
MKPEGLEHVKGAIRTIEAEAQRKKHHGEVAVTEADEKEAKEEAKHSLNQHHHIMDQKEEVRMMQDKAKYTATKATQSPANGKNVRKTAGIKQPTQGAI